jgi:hypothetical protein
VITRAGIQRALEFAQSSLSNSSAVPSGRVDNYYNLFKDRDLSDEQFLQGVKEVVLQGSNFLPRPKEILEATLRLKPRAQIPYFDPSEVREKNPPPVQIREWVEQARNGSIFKVIDSHN